MHNSLRNPNELNQNASLFQETYVVILHENGLGATHLSIDVITLHSFPRHDSLVKVATIQTARGIAKHPTCKVAALLLDNDAAFSIFWEGGLGGGEGNIWTWTFM